MKIYILVLAFIFLACIGIIIYLLVNRQNESSTENVNIPSTADEFNALFESAVTRLHPLIAFGGCVLKKANATDSKKLQLCIRELEACIAFKGDHWQSMFFISKGYQALGEHENKTRIQDKSIDFRNFLIKLSKHVMTRQF